jgi:hypothetical protein
MGLFGKKEKYKPLEATLVEFRSLNGLHVSDDELHQMCDGLPIVTYKKFVNEIRINGKTPITHKDCQLVQIRMLAVSSTSKNQQYYISANTNLDIEGQIAERNTKRVDIPIIQSNEEISSLRRFDSYDQQSFKISFQIKKTD